MENGIEFEGVLDYYSVFFLIFQSFPHGGSLTLYSSLSDHPDPTLVNHLSPYLSTRLIRHIFWLSMSCGSQDSNVQGSSPHKCGQKSSFSAFNAVVVAFPYIFLDSLPSRMFMRHVPITGASIKVTFIVGAHI